MDKYKNRFIKDSKTLELVSKDEFKSSSQDKCYSRLTELMLSLLYIMRMLHTAASACSQEWGPAGEAASLLLASVVWPWASDPGRGLENNAVNIKKHWAA